MDETPRKVLVVEDEQLLLQALSDGLQKAGFHVVTAVNGKLGLAEAQKERPDIIILDIMMPVMDGIAMLQELRLAPWGKDTPVIILSNATGMDKVSAALQSGVTEYVVKSEASIADITARIQKKFQKEG